MGAFSTDDTAFLMAQDVARQLEFMIDFLYLDCLSSALLDILPTGHIKRYLSTCFKKYQKPILIFIKNKRAGLKHFICLIKEYYMSHHKHQKHRNGNLIDLLNIPDIIINL